jgi:agmatinase
LLHRVLANEWQAPNIAVRGRTFTGYDLVEVAPAYDTNAQTTALLAANIAYEFSP